MSFDGGLLLRNDRLQQFWVLLQFCFLVCDVSFELFLFLSAVAEQQAVPSDWVVIEKPRYFLWFLLEALYHRFQPAPKSASGGGSTLLRC